LTTIKLYNEIIEDLRTSKPLSKILPSVLILSKKIKDENLQKWTELESKSYYNSNEALTNDIIVPEYRIVAGQYHDLYNRPLILQDPEYKFVNEYRLREGVLELEKLASSTKLLTIVDPTFTELINKHFAVEVHSFTYSPRSIDAILESIRFTLINKLMAVAQKVENVSNSDKVSEHTIYHNAIANLHPLVQQIASGLFADGHYRQALLDCYILLIEAVKTKSGRRDIDGTSLMQTVFSPRNPIIKVSEDPDIQQGFMFMFSGPVMGIRNPAAHSLVKETDPQKTLEWLSFASVLLRTLDESKVLT
jgi:uncharacterized protein (TIGR02391 family)